MSASGSSSTGSFISRRWCQFAPHPLRERQLRARLDPGAQHRRDRRAGDALFLARNSRHSTSVATDPSAAWRSTLRRRAPRVTSSTSTTTSVRPGVPNASISASAPASLTTSRATPWIRTEYGATLGGSRPTEPQERRRLLFLQRRRSLRSSRERVQRRRASHSQDVKYS